MRHSMRVGAVVVVFSLIATPDARGHFLFIHIGPAAEAGRLVDVRFSLMVQSGDATYIDKIAHTQLWAQSTPGQFQPLKVHKAWDHLRALVPGTGSVAVIGECQYGVLARPNQTAFLLRYYPKAVAGSPEDLNRMMPRPDTPLEIMATFQGDAVGLVALEAGKPNPNAVFTTVDVDLVNEEFSADSHGRATWTPPSPGRYLVYTRRNLKETGEVGGKRYDEIRAFATLAFTWPIERRGSDSEAVAMFEQAIAARAQWQDFPGFQAQIAGVVDDQEFNGSATVDADGNASLEINDAAAKSWVKNQLESIAMHRGAGAQGSSARGESRPVLRFADDQANHPLGRLLLFEGGSFASSYRIKDNQITVVNRRMGRHNMTITVLDNERNAEGLFLPRSYTVQYWDAETGELRRTETIQDRWSRVGSWDLPASHTLTTASETGLSVRQFVLSRHQLLE